MNDAPFFLEYHRHRQTSSHWRIGFTLLEMVVAMVLLAVLVTTVVNVLRVLLVETRQAEVTRATVLPESLARQLRRDVINARSYRLNNSQLDLLGYVAQDADSGQPLLTMAVASYQIRATQRGGLLMRVQQSLSEGNGAAPATIAQPLWQGVTAIALTSNYLDTRDFSLLAPEWMQAASALQSADGSDWLPLSPSVELSLQGDMGQSLFRETIARDVGASGGAL